MRPHGHGEQVHEVTCQRCETGRYRRHQAAELYGTITSHHCSGGAFAEREADDLDRAREAL